MVFRVVTNKWNPNFLQQYKTIQEDVKNYHFYQGRKICN